MYFHFLQTGYLSDRNLESLSVCLLLIINTWRGTVKKVCPKVLELWTIFFFKYTTLECKGSGLIFFGSQFLSTWLLPKFRKGSCLLFWSSCSGWPRHKVEREGDLGGATSSWFPKCPYRLNFEKRWGSEGLTDKRQWQTKDNRHDDLMQLQMNGYDMTTWCN